MLSGLDRGGLDLGGLLDGDLGHDLRLDGDLDRDLSHDRLGRGLLGGVLCHRPRSDAASSTASIACASTTSATSSATSASSAAVTASPTASSALASMVSVVAGSSAATAATRSSSAVAVASLRLVGRLAPALLLCGQCGGLLRVDLPPGQRKARATCSGHHPSEVGRPCPFGLVRLLRRRSARASRGAGPGRARAYYHAASSGHNEEERRAACPSCPTSPS